VVTNRIADHVGRVLGGRYRLLAPIGTGASGHVFVADDITLRRRVAVKVLHTGLAGDESFLRRFRAEAQAAANLNHPNVMRVFDWGEDADGPYLVLEHLGGGSLRDLLDQGHRLTPSQALLVGLEAARALDYAHRRGLVHRDVKPANLLFDDEGRVCIADFGLARALAEAAWTEPSGAVLGTARYASPEQAKGLSLDGKADVYSLALTLVEAVTGQVPFTADTTIGTLMARTDRSLQAPPELGPLGSVVESAGRLDPAERVDAAGLVGGLNRAASDLPAPGPLPLAGAVPLDASRVVDERDVTMMGAAAAAAAVAGPATSRLFDREADPVVLDDAPPKKRTRRALLWILAVAAAVMIGATAAYALNRAVLPTHAVPDLTGRTTEQAKAALSPLKLKLRVTQRSFFDGSSAGQILSQSPAPHQKAKEQSSIGVVVSRGPPPVDVPDLTGKTQAEATSLLTTAGFAVAVIETPDENVKKGLILDWGPKVASLPKHSTVTIKVSTGPAPRPIADWKGKTFEEAKAALEDQGFKVTKKESYSDDVKDAGKVISTEPGAGKQAAYGSTIVVNVSKGAMTIELPDVVGKSVTEASRILTDLGFNVYSFGRPNNTQVVGTDPKPGTKVQRGRDITLLTGK
jgi:serine/threonine-protein kinase